MVSDRRGPAGCSYAHGRPDVPSIRASQHGLYVVYPEHSPPDLTKMCGRVCFALCEAHPAAPTSGTVGRHKKNTAARAGAAAQGKS
jgi:hypothetical protein